jgi:prolyl-tRNA editing enzyme YbaK/EbsC (Cys-tRNA(Pro) deacylase)
VRTSVDVHNFLVDREVPHEVFSTRGRLRSAERIAGVLGLPPEDVGKVVVFEGRGRPVAVAVPAGADPDLHLVRAAVGENDLRRVSRTRASELTGYLYESIPPVGLPKGFRLVLDRSLHRDAVLYFPGGEARSVLKVRGTDLARATGSVVAEVTRGRCHPAPG